MYYRIIQLISLALGLSIGIGALVNTVSAEDVPRELQYGVLSSNSDGRLSEIRRNGFPSYEFVPLEGREGGHRVRREVTVQPISNASAVSITSTAAPVTANNVTTGKPVENNGTAATAGSVNATTATSGAPGSGVVIDGKQLGKNETGPGITSSDSFLTPPGYPEFNGTFWDGNGEGEQNLKYDENSTHGYYNSSIFINGSGWEIDVDKAELAEEHQLLSNSYRRAVTLKLKFTFPFYGHIVDNVTIATGGFMYLGEQVHSWLAATQYVAPLMANFDSSLSDNSTVIIVSAAKYFTVEWRHMHLRNSENKTALEENKFFTFQATLHENGTIVFFYKALPMPFNQIQDAEHPVKVGLSDAYIREQQVIFFKKKTIYEYHRLDVKEKPNVFNGTAIVFFPLPTCLSFKTCEDCTNHNSSFACAWCPSKSRCSDGLDRYRQDWIASACEHDSFNVSNQCLHSSKNNYTTDTSTHAPFDHNEIDTSKASKQSAQSTGMSAGGIMSLLFFIMLIVGAVGWVLYAYNFPHTTSGQILIRYRPTQWGFRRGEARYTAASIHM